LLRVGERRTFGPGGCLPCRVRPQAQRGECPQEGSLLVGRGRLGSALALLLVLASAAAWADETTTVFLVNHGWHVGLAVPRADVAPALWPESGAFGPVRYLEVGWGDGDYYPAAEVTPAIALRAAAEAGELIGSTPRRATASGEVRSGVAVRAAQRLRIDYWGGL